MNTNPSAKRILCYGDSNTHARDPKRKAEEGIKTRFPVGVRWTSQLQNLLGNGYEVIEEGLGGRTTDLEDPSSPYRNGLTYLLPCVESHQPVELIILMLGTNDLKEVFGRSATQIAKANQKLVHAVRSISPQSQIILISPILVNDKHLMAQDNYRGAAEKSKQLATELGKIAEEESCQFIDLAQFVEPSSYDGLHIDEKDQATVARVVFEKVKEII